MAKGEENGTTILLGLKDYHVGEIWGGGEKVVVKTAVKGRTPMQTFTESAHLVKEKMLDEMRADNATCQLLS